MEQNEQTSYVSPEDRGVRPARPWDSERMTEPVIPTRCNLLPPATRGCHPQPEAVQQQLCRDAVPTLPNAAATSPSPSPGSGPNNLWLA